MPEVETLRPGFLRAQVKLPGFVSMPVLHRIELPDGGQYHSHPGEFQSFVTHGWYVDEVLHLDCFSRVLSTEFSLHRLGASLHFPAGRVHRIMEVAPGGCETVTIWGKTDQRVLFWRVVDGRAQAEPR